MSRWTNALLAMFPWLGIALQFGRLLLYADTSRRAVREISGSETRYRDEDTFCKA